jgi:hypothetical protein
VAGRRRWLDSSELGCRAAPFAAPGAEDAQDSASPARSTAALVLARLLRASGAPPGRRDRRLSCAPGRREGDQGGAGAREVEYAKTHQLGYLIGLLEAGWMQLPYRVCRRAAAAYLESAGTEGEAPRRREHLISVSPGWSLGWSLGWSSSLPPSAKPCWPATGCEGGATIRRPWGHRPPCLLVSPARSKVASPADVDRLNSAYQVLRVNHPRSTRSHERVDVVLEPLQRCCKRDRHTAISGAVRTTASGTRSAGRRVASDEAPRELNRPRADDVPVAGVATRRSRAGEGAGR